MRVHSKDRKYGVKRFTNEMYHACHLTNYADITVTASTEITVVCVGSPLVTLPASQTWSVTGRVCHQTHPRTDVTLVMWSLKSCHHGDQSIQFMKQLMAEEF